MMNNTKHLIPMLVCLLVGSLQLHAQIIRFQQKLVTTNGDNKFYSAVQNQDGTYDLIGSSSTSAASGGTDVLRTHIDKWGDPSYSTWATSGTTGGDYGRSMTAGPSGGYVVAGYTDVAGNEDIQVFCYGYLYFLGRRIGGAGNERANCIKLTSDGGYIIAGYTTSFGAGNTDGYLVKLNPNGSIAWTRTYGTIQPETFTHVTQTSDGGYIVTGSGLTSYAALEDILVVKFTSTGNVTWARTYAYPGTQNASPNETGCSVVETADGYAVAAATHFGGMFNWQFTLLKTDFNGNLSFMKTYQLPSTYGYAYDLQQTTDGGYIMCGAIAGDPVMLKTDASGNLSWAKAYDNTNIGFLHDVMQTAEGGYLGTGYSGTSAFIVKTDANGASGCEEITISPSVISINPVIVTLGTNTGSGGTVTVNTLSQTSPYTSDVEVPCRACPADAGPNRLNEYHPCCPPPTCTSVQIGTPALPGYTYNWSPASDLSCSNCAQPNASPCGTTMYVVMVSGPDCMTNIDAVEVITGLFDCCGAPKRMTQDNSMSISIYPNPSQGQISVSLPVSDSLQTSTIEITDITGKQVLCTQTTIGQTQLEIDLSGLAKGTYFIKAGNDTQSVIEQFILE